MKFTTIRILLVWFLVVMTSGMGFSFLAKHPDLMLWVEEIHPSNAYLRGRELLADGKREEALATFRKGYDYFSKIANQTQLRRHRLQVVQGLLEMASVYRDSTDPHSLRQAVELYSQATAIDPLYSKGQPFLSKGDILTRLKQYPEAIQAYTNAIENGSALVALEAVYNRGTCFFEQGKFESAWEDWYDYARFKPDLPYEKWERFLAISENSDGMSLYVRARALDKIGKNEQSQPLWLTYMQQNPDDRSALFYSRIENNPQNPNGEENVSLQDLFPHRETMPYPLQSEILDLYSDLEKNITITLQAAISTKEIPSISLSIDRENRSLGTLYILDAEFKTYSVDLTLKKGMNQIHLHVLPNEGDGIVTPLLLRSLTVRLQS